MEDWEREEAQERRLEQLEAWLEHWPLLNWLYCHLIIQRLGLTTPAAIFSLFRMLAFVLLLIVTGFVWLLLTGCSSRGDGSDGTGDKAGADVKNRYGQLDRQMTVGMTENPDSMLGVVDSLQQSGWLPRPIADYERGTCYALMEKRRIAEYYYTRALDDGRLMELWPRAYYRASVNLAILLSGKGDEERALQVATRAYGRLQESADSPDATQWKGGLLFNIGSSQLNLGYTAEGRETLRAAMTHVRIRATEDPNNENLRTWATLAVNAATVLMNNHQDGQLAAIREAEDAVKAMSRSREVPPALTDMLRGKVASLKAMYYVEQGQTAEANTAYRQYLATDYASMPQTYTERLTFLEKSGRWEEAASLLPAIWQVHEEIDMRPDITYMSDLAEGYTVYRKTGQRDSALSVGDRMAAMIDSVRKYNMEDGAAELAVIYDTQQKETEIYQQRSRLRTQQLVAVIALLTLMLAAYAGYNIYRRRVRKMLEKARKERERMESELRVAHDIQMSMVPGQMPEYPGLDLYAMMQPAREVGGDLYDYFILDGKLFFSIGDVSGKGIPAAMVMTVSVNLFRTFAREGFSPAYVATRLNEALSRDNDSGMFCTMFLGILDLTTGTLDYCNAGHTPPLMDGEYLEMETNAPLGLWPDLEFVSERIDDVRGHTLFFYTDGITEAEDVAQIQYGEERLQQLLCPVSEESSWQTADRIVADVTRHVDGAEASDDITLMVIKLKSVL